MDKTCAEPVYQLRVGKTEDSGVQERPNEISKLMWHNVITNNDYFFLF